MQSVPMIGPPGKVGSPTHNPAVPAPLNRFSIGGAIGGDGSEPDRERIEEEGFYVKGVNVLSAASVEARN